MTTTKNNMGKGISDATKLIKIELTQNKVALVDEIDKDLVERNWCAYKSGNAYKSGKHIIRFYATRYEHINGKYKKIRMHRVILERMLGRELIKGEDVDHINHDGLDNRRVNLRLATHAENMRNRVKRINCSSEYKGVCWYKPNKKWQAEIRIDGKQKRLGRFESEIEAAKAYDIAAIGAYGEFCCLNFPV
jgi:hypothetical protein